MVYNFHSFYYWVKGGVEAGQAYRAELFRKMGIDAKFIFATSFPSSVFENEMHRLGYEDSETAWMYTGFSDRGTEISSYSFEDFLKTINSQDYHLDRKDNGANVRIDSLGIRYAVSFIDGSDDIISDVAVLSNERLLRVDHYAQCLLWSEFFTPVNGQAKSYMKRFYNSDGSVSCEEIEVSDEQYMYRVDGTNVYSREELLGLYMKKLNLTEDDIVIVDGEPSSIELSAFIDNAAPAKVCFFMHGGHCINAGYDYVQWYYIYEYALNHPEKIDCFIVNTETQAAEVRSQLKKYKGIDADVRSIPVKGITELKGVGIPRKKHSLIYAGRLAIEKKVELAIKAVAISLKQIPDITLDIYGDGPDHAAMENLINELGCSDSIHLCGFHDLEHIYEKYDAFLTSSLGETFGITYLEAVSAGLPIVSFDVPYGSEVFVSDGANGFKTSDISAESLADCIIKLFSHDDLTDFIVKSYEKAVEFMEDRIEAKWRDLFRDLKTC